MDLQNLTKKNQEFIHTATNQLIQDGKTDGEIKAILENVLPTILENQKKGLTARSLLGAPTVWAKTFTDTSVGKSEEKNTNPWLMWLDTSLLFVGVVALLNAVMTLFNSSTTTSGIFSIIGLGLGGGAAMYVTYYFIYRHMGKDRSERPGILKSILVIGLAMLAWIVLYSATALLPSSLNPQLPSFVLIIIGGAALLGRYFLQKKYNVLNAMASQVKK